MLDKIVKICAALFLIIWSIAGLLFISSGISLVRRLANTNTASQPVSASKLTQAQADCLKKAWGEDTFNKYKNDLRQSPTDLQQKALSCFPSTNN